MIKEFRRWLASKIAPPGESAGTWQKCRVCEGKGHIYETDGWFGPEWSECTSCLGTGEASKALSCGCYSVHGKITNCRCYMHVLGGPEFVS